MGLTHPTDLAAWSRWQRSRNRLRSLKGSVLDRGPARGTLTLGSPDADLLVALDAGTPSQVAALLAPLAHVAPERLAILAPHDPRRLLPAAIAGHPWQPSRWTAGEVDRRLDGTRAVIGVGHYLPIGRAGYVVARTRGVPFLAVQHGLLTPHAPPLPGHARLLAWSEADASFWTDGRDDVETTVVGSQLLWQARSEAGGDADVPRDPAGPATYLGQLHAAELPREDLVEAAEAFCRINGATYRPHPAEADRRSRRQHARWEALGIDVDPGGPPLAELGTPVVSVFSTGVLEAAARGLPAWVDYPRPPAWLEEFWERYAMARWSTAHPTLAPDLPATAPARLVAACLAELG